MDNMAVSVHNSAEVTIEHEESGNNEEGGI